MRYLGNVLLLAMIGFPAFDSGACARVVRKRDFSITIPDYWAEVPRSVLDQVEKELKKHAPEAAIPHYDYAFQRTTAKTRRADP